MRLHLTLKDLPMATSTELYQISWVIEQLLVDLRRIVQARRHAGTQARRHAGTQAAGSGPAGAVFQLGRRQAARLARGIGQI